MSKDNWIAIGGIIIQSIIAVIGIVINLKMSKRQIQVMLAQANPDEKRPRKKIIWEAYVVLLTYSVSLVVTLLIVLYFFVSTPFSPRVLMLLTLLNVFNAVTDYRVLRLWWRKPRSVIVET